MGSTHRTYYSTLDVSAQASQDDIRRSWRSLVLLYHPDKSSSTGAAGSDREEKLLEVNRAWEVLRDPITREAYDKSLLFASTSSAKTRQPTKSRPPPPLARTVISLDLFTPHFAPSSASSISATEEDEHTDEEGEPTHYTHPCRCSAILTITHTQLEEGVEVIGCDGCGDWIRVGYEVLEEEEEE